MADTDNLFTLDGRVAVRKALPVGFQHVLAMFVSNVTPIIILCGALNMGNMAPTLVQNAMFIAGIGTLIQLYPVWRVGARLPIVMGISFTFLSLAIGIGTKMGYGALLGAIIVGGIVEGLLGLMAKYWIRLISPVVAATVVTGIGFSLLPIGANSFGGGMGSPEFGSASNWIVGSATLLTCLCCQIFAKGYFRTLAVLCGLVVGYVLALCMGGMVDLSGFDKLSAFAIPQLCTVAPEFHMGAILSFVVIFLVSATETIGDTSALVTTALGRSVTPRELSGSLACDGFISSVSGCLGCTPITSFSQNVGLVAMTKVVNRFTLACGASVMVLAGLIPSVGKILTSIPQCVLGGCTIMMFGTIMFAGFKMLSRCGFTNRNLVIVAVALSIGLGFSQTSAIFAKFPELFRNVFADNCVATVFVIAIILDLIIPKNCEDIAPKN